MSGQTDTYRRHLSSAAWRHKREQVLERAAGHCERCQRPAACAGHEPAKCPYKNFTSEWFRRHPVASHCSCASCRADRRPAEGRLEVHHLTYERLGDEELGDLEALCRKCHAIADMERKERVRTERWMARVWGFQEAMWERGKRMTWEEAEEDLVRYLDDLEEAEWLD